MARMAPPRPPGTGQSSPGRHTCPLWGAQARGAVACPHPRGCSGGTGRTHVWWAQAKVGHSVSWTCVSSSGTPPCPQASGPCMRTSDGQQPPNQARVPGRPSGALPCSHPAPSPLRAESREGWGAGGFQSRNTLPQADTTPLVSDARPERAGGRLEGEPIALKTRNQQTRPHLTARPASARLRRDGSHLNLDRPTAEAPAPEPPDTAVPVSPQPQPGGHTRAGMEAGTRRPGPPGCSSGNVGETAPGTDRLLAPG